MCKDQHILAAFPRVCMGHAFQQHLDGVVWEDPSEHLQAWKDGRTGYPLVDAGIRQMKLEVRLSLHFCSMPHADYWKGM